MQEEVDQPGEKLDEPRQQTSNGFDPAFLSAGRRINEFFPLARS